MLWLGASFAVLQRLRGRQAPPREEPLPAELASSVEHVRLRTRDGVTLGAWFIDASEPGAASVLELHGRGGTRQARLGAAGVLRERGCAVLLVTLRAHGDSDGQREDFGWSARHDVVAAVEWLHSRRPGRTVLVHGASLGAAAAVFAAPELPSPIGGFALECLYADLETAARRRCELELFPPFDWLAWQGLRTVAQVVWPEFGAIAPVEHVAALPRVPLLLLTGTADRHTRADEAAALLDRIGARARHVAIAGAEHDRLQRADPGAYRAALLTWLAECERSAATR